MTTLFELLEDKVQYQNLKADDHIMIDDMLWRVINNFRVIGGNGRMLMLSYHTHVDHRNGYRFHHIPGHQGTARVEVFRAKE